MRVSEPSTAIRTDNPGMESGLPAWTPFDVAAYARRSREGPCFVCALLAGDPATRTTTYTRTTRSRSWPARQFYALTAENSVLDIDDAAQSAVARAIRSHLGDSNLK
jgi:hypothetical protein